MDVIPTSPQPFPPEPPRHPQEKVDRDRLALGPRILQQMDEAYVRDVEERLSGRVTLDAGCDRIKEITGELFERVKLQGYPTQTERVAYSHLELYVNRLEAELQGDAEAKKLILDYKRKLKALAQWMDYRSEFANASDKVFNSLADFDEQMMKVESGSGEIYLDHLVSAVAAIPSLIKVIQSGANLSSTILQKDVGNLAKRDLKHLAYTLEHHLDNFMKYIVGVIEGAKAEHRAAQEAWDGLKDSADPLDLLNAAVRLNEAAAHLDRVLAEGRQAKKLSAVAEKVKEAAPEVAAVLSDRGEKLAAALPAKRGERASRAEDLAERLASCKGVEEALTKPIAVYGKAERDDREAILRCARRLAPLLSDPVLGSSYPEARAAADAFVAEHPINPRELRSSYLDDLMTAEQKSDLLKRTSMPNENDDKISKVGLFFLGLQAMVLLRGAGSLLLGHDAAALRAQAEQMHRQAVDTIDPKLRTEIEEDASFMGTLLTDHWEGLKDNKYVSRLSPQAREVVQYLLKNFHEAPNSSQIQAARDVVINARLGQHVPSPYQHLSIGEWFEEFTRQEHEEVPAQVAKISATPYAELPQAETAQGRGITERIWNVFSEALYWLGYETPSHHFERFQGVIREHINSLALVRADAEALLEYAKAGGISPSLTVPQIPELSVTSDNCESVAATLGQAVAVHSAEVEKLRDQLISQALRQGQLVQLQSFLESPPIRPIDPSLFQHIMLDYSGKETGYEGYASLPMLEYKLQLVEGWVDALEHNPLCSPSQKEELCRTVLGDFLPWAEKERDTFKVLRDNLKTAIYLTQKLNGPLDEFHTAITEQVAGMKEGDSFFLQTAWRVAGLGHAIVLEFIKLGETFTVRLYNRGQGVERHAEAMVGTQLSHLSFIEIEKVEQDAITSPVFIGLIAALEGGEFIHRESVPFMYEDVLPILGGVKSERIYTPEHVQELLGVGHCSWLSLTALDYQRLTSSDSYQRWSLLTKLYALQHMYRSSREAIAQDKGVRELLRMGSSQVAKDISSMPLELFSNAERVYVSKLQAALRADIDHADARALAQGLEKRPIADMAVPVPVFGKNSTVDMSGQPKEWGARSIGDAGDPHLLMSQLRSYIPSPSTVTGHVKAILDAGKPTSNTVEAMAAAKPILSELIRLLPLDSEFWRGVSPDDASALLDTLLDHSHHFLNSVLASGARISSSDMMVMLKVFTLANMAIQQLPADQRVDLDHLLAPSYRQFLQSEMPNSELADPLWQEQFEKLKEYWLDRPEEKDYAGPSFFLTEGFVPGIFGPAIEYAVTKTLDSAPWTPLFRSDERGDRMGSEWPALTWLEKWVDQNSQRAAMGMFASKAPDTRGKALYLLADVVEQAETFGKRPSDKHLLPKGFSVLHDLCKDLAWLTAASEIRFEQLPYRVRPRLIISLTGDHPPPRYYLSYSDDVGMPFQEQKVASAPDHLSSRLNGQDLGANLEKLYLSDKADPRLGKLRRRIDPTRRVLFRKDVADLGLPSELVHRIEACSSIKQLQISETLAFFSDHRNLLDHPHYRTLFAKLLLEPGLLEERLLMGQEEAAATLSSLSTLFGEHFRLKERLGEIEIAGDLLELYDYVSKIIDRTKRAHPDLLPPGFSVDFPNARQEWRRLLSSDLSDDERSRYAADLALSYVGSDALDAQAVGDILAALLWVDKNPLPNDHPLWNSIKDLEFRTLPQHLAGLLNQAIPEKDDQVIARAIRRVIPDFQMRPFIRTDRAHIYRDEGGDVEVNLLTGHVWFSGGQPRILPKVLSTHRVLEKLQPPVHTLAWREGVPGQFRADTPQGEITIFANDELQLEEIQWKTEGATYRFTEWSKTTEFPGLIREAGLLWTKISGEEPFNTALVTPLDQLTPLYRIDSGNFVDRIALLDSSGRSTGLVLGQTPDLFALLDKPEYIGTWIDEITNLPVKVTLPRLGLEFNIETVDGQRRAYCPHFPGWYIPVDELGTRLQHLPALGAMSNYIVLHKDRPGGTLEREVIIPEQRLEQGKRPLAPQLTPVWPEGLSSSTAVHRYGIDEETGQLRPQGTAAFRHLAAVYWQQRDYRRAIDLIQAYGSELGKLDEPQRKLIIQLTEMPKLASDYSPPSLAAALEAHYLLLRDRWDFGSEKELEKETAKKLLEDYLDYLQVFEQTGIYSLSPEKERLIIRHLDLAGLSEKYAPIIDRRRSVVFDQPMVFEKVPMLPSGMVKVDIDTSRGGSLYAGAVLYNRPLPIKIEKKENQWIATNEYGTQITTPYLGWVDVEDCFVALYELARNQTEESLAKMVKYLTGLDLSGDLRQHAIEALKAHARYKQYIKGDEPLITAALISVLRDPEAFPTAATLKARMAENGNWDEVSAEEKALYDQHFETLDTHGDYIFIEKSMVPTADLVVAPGERQEISKAHIPRRLLIEGEVSAPARQDVRYQLCTNLRPEVMDLGQSMLTDFQDAITVRPMTAEDKALRNKGLEELEDVFKVHTEDKVLEGAFASVAEEIEKFRTGLEDENVFTLNAGAKEVLERWSLQLYETAAALGSDLEQAQRSVVRLANKPPEDPNLFALYQQEIEGKRLELLDFNTLTSFLLTRDMEELHRRMPYLTVDEVHQVFDATVEALKIGRLQRYAVYQHQLVAQLQAAIKRGEPEVEISRIAKLLEASHRYHPSYRSNEHPEYLVYDYFMGKDNPQFRLRADQVAVLEVLPERQFHAHTDHLTGVLLEAIMGFGKTDVVSVLQAVQEADGDKLVAVSMPEALLPSMSGKLQRILGSSFRRIVEVVKFDRDSDVSAPALRHLLSRFKDIREGRRVMLISSSSALSIALRFVEMALQGESVTDEQLELMSEVVSILRTSGFANLDEVDILLDVLQAHLFTLGDYKRVHVDMETAQLSLFEAISLNEELRNLIRWPFAPGTSEIPFSEQNYLTHAKEPLIEAILDGKIGPKDLTLKNFLNDLNRDERKLVGDYLRAEPKEPEQLIALFRRLEPAQRKALATYIVEGTGALPSLTEQERRAVEEYKEGRSDPAYAFVSSIVNPRIKNLLATYKDQVSKLFPLVMTKILGENYGPLPKEWRGDQNGMEFVAIPYHGSGNPARRALHGTVSEILDYTVMMHLAQPIDMEIVDRELAKLKAQLDEEMEKGIESAEESEALQAFSKLGGEGSLAGQITEAQKERIAAHINQHPELKIELIRTHVLPQVKRYPRQLGLASQMVAYLFASVKAYSGTLWNLVTFPQLFHKLIPSDTQPRTLELLWRNSPHEIEMIPEHLNIAPLSERVAYIYGGKEPFLGSFADLQGTFRNEANIEVARAIINLPQFEGSRYQAIMFHNDRGQEMVLRRGDLEPVPLAIAGISRDNVAGFWAQKYCTGVDWKLHPLEEAKVTVGRQTLMRDGLQAVWRLRGLAEGQKVSFIVPEEDFRIIASELKRVFDIDVGDALRLEHFFIYALYLEKERLRSDTPRALKEALKAHLIDKVFGAIKGAKAADLRSLFQLTAELFIIEEPDSPWEQMGNNPSEAPKEIVVAENLRQLFTSKAFAAFSTHPLLQKYAPDELKQQLREIADSYIDKLSDTLTTGPQANTENEVETEAQKLVKAEAQRRVEAETKKEMHVHIQSASFTQPRPVLLLPEGALLQAKTWKPIIPATVARAFYPVNQVVRVNDLIDQPIFSDNLTIDLNLAPIYSRSSGSEPPYKPWNAYQDLDTTVVVIDDGTSIQLAMVSQDTAKQVQEELKQAQPGEVRIALYNLDSGLVKQGPNPIDIDKLSKDERFMTLKVQAKFFDGRTRYTAQEKPYLKAWLLSTNRVKEMQELFLRKILVNKDDATNRFSGSTIEKLFKELLEKKKLSGGDPESF